MFHLLFLAEHMFFAGVEITYFSPGEQGCKEFVNRVFPQGALLQPFGCDERVPNLCWFLDCFGRVDVRKWIPMTMM